MDVSLRSEWYWLGLVSIAGCANLFGIDVPPLIHAAEAGAAGVDTSDGGAGVFEPPGTAGSEEPAGASPGAEGGAPDRGAGGRAASGGAKTGARGGSDAGGHGGSHVASGGRDTGGGGAGVHGTGGHGGDDQRGGNAGTGAAGASGSDGIVQMDAACARAGAVACPFAMASSWLICKDGTWQLGGACPAQQYCDRRTGACAPTVLGCDQPGDKSCEFAESGASEAVTCGPDLVSVDIEECLFDCDPSAGCLPPVNDEVVLEPVPPPIQTDHAYWPGPTIPVCVTNAERPEWASVEDEVARTWGRYGGVAFTGWARCDGDEPGVVATLVTDPCQGELGSVDRVGYPGSTAAVHVSICASYEDASGTPTTAPDALLRLIARHEFGHVLGFADSPVPNDPNDFMARAIHTGQLDQYPFTEFYEGALVDAYGRKPAGALVDERGDCLTVANGALGFGVCDGSTAQVFTFAHGELVNEATGGCVSSAPSEAATIATCTTGTPAAANQDFRPREVQIRGYGGGCFATRPLDDGAAGLDGGAGPEGLGADACPDFATPSALWTLEFVDGGTRARLRQANDTRCVIADPIALTFSVDTCDACAETDANCPIADRFTLTPAGQIRLGGYCFEELASLYLTSGVASDFGLRLAPCTLAASMFWNLSGRVESAAGTALTRPFDSEASALLAEPIGATTFGDQIFDLYFSNKDP